MSDNIEATPTDEATAPAENELVQPAEAQVETPKPEDDETGKRISRLAYEAREAKKLARQMKAELDQLRAHQKPANEADDIDRRVAERAAQMSAANEFNKTCNDIFEKGVKEFGSEFHDTVRHLNDQLGSIPPHMIEAAVDAGDAHKLLHHLAQNPDELEDIAGLPPHRMGAAVAKLASKLTAKPVKPVSNAPAPIKPVSGNAKGDFDPTTASIADYMRWEDERQMKRRRGEL